MAGEDGRADEIVIVRRRGGADDDHHHGGVWKIAYADFMTAMMALFLVMWLINASNTETKSSIASYFNPVKLTDNVSRKKGLYDIDEKSNAAQASKAESKGDEAGASKKQRTTGPEAGGEANKAIPHHGEAPPPKPESNGTGASGEAFRDPFNPLASARHLMQGLPKSPAVDTAAQASERAENDRKQDAFAAHRGEKVSQLRQEIERAIQRLGLASGPGLDIMTEGRAIVLSLTDTSTFGMFAVGSAKPSDDLVKLIGAITPIVIENGGRLTIRGHTDSRPFPGAVGNNNWRLSMERAEAIYSMLIRARVEDSRFDRIEARADRSPKDPSDPAGAVNRRIDILLEPVDR